MSQAPASYYSLYCCCCLCVVKLCHLIDCQQLVAWISVCVVNCVNVVDWLAWAVAVVSRRLSSDVHVADDGDRHIQLSQHTDRSLFSLLSVHAAAAVAYLVLYA